MSQSGLTINEDFSVAFSPERINPGDKKHSIRNTSKVVGASNRDALVRAQNLYLDILDTSVHTVSNIKVAEASKILENTQRDVNIALMNEFSIYCKAKGIDVFEVIEAAKTKWNFCDFHPGLVGGHCIGVDPYYLISDSKKTEMKLNLIETARQVNETLSSSIASEIYEKWVNREYGKDRLPTVGVL